MVAFRTVRKARRIKRMDEKFIEKDFYHNLSEELKKIVKAFSSAPFLFIGAGFSRRYMNTPSWEELLTYCSGMTREDDPGIAFKFYEMNASYSNEEDKLPAIASEIKKDFDRKWLGDKNFRQNHPIKNNESDPFHSFVSQYIETFEWDKSTYKEELDLFRNLCGSSIAGIITTNYDCLLDKLSGFKSYVGQSELLVSDPQEIAEIYKIHGSIEKPESIILTMEDYSEFREKAKYLSAKLITIFMEHPIFFIGYSLTDKDILDLLKTIVGCFDKDNKNKLKVFQSRLFFVSYEPESASGISEYGITYGDLNILNVRRIAVPNFKCIFEALLQFRMGIPIKLLRRLKNQFADFMLNNESNSTVQVADLNNEKVSENSIAIYIGNKKELASTIGLIGKESKDVYLDILYDDIGYAPKEILQELLPRLEKSNIKLPKYKYYAALSQSEITKQIREDFPEIQSDIFSHKKEEKRSIDQILEDELKPSMNGDESMNYNIAMNRMLEIPTPSMDLERLRSFLLEIIRNNPDLFSKKQDKSSVNPTNVRKLIRKYDYGIYYVRAMKNLSFNEEHSS